MSRDFDSKSYLDDAQREKLASQQNYIKRVKPARRGPDSSSIAIASLSVTLSVLVVVLIILLISGLEGSAAPGVAAITTAQANAGSIPITATLSDGVQATAVLPEFYIVELSATAPANTLGPTSAFGQATPTSAFQALPTQFSLNSSVMVFVCHIEGHDDICRMNADGSNFKRLTNTPGTDWYPSIGSNGEFVVYSSHRSGKWDLWLMDIEGSRQTQITNDLNEDFAPDLSPDGTKVVFASTTSSTDPQNIWVINVDGTGLTQLTDTQRDDIDPTWSPDGSQILFSSNRNGLTDLYVMNADGSNVRQITKDVNNGGRNDWSPDGRWITFYAGGAGEKSIYIMEANCAQSQTGCITEPRILVAEGNSKGPSFSPDSQWVVFAGSNFQGDWDNEIYIVNINGDIIYQLTSNGYADWQPRWAP